MPVFPVVVTATALVTTTVFVEAEDEELAKLLAWQTISYGDKPNFYMRDKAISV